MTVVTPYIPLFVSIRIDTPRKRWDFRDQIPQQKRLLNSSTLACLPSRKLSIFLLSQQNTRVFIYIYYYVKHLLGCTAVMGTGKYK